jgi:hypothetical protein
VLGLGHCHHISLHKGTSTTRFCGNILNKCNRKLHKVSISHGPEDHYSRAISGLTAKSVCDGDSTTYRSAEEAQAELQAKQALDEVRMGKLVASPLHK